MRVIIVGAGYVGGALAERLASSPHEVWALRRSEVEPSRSGVRWIRGDVVTGAGLGALPKDADAVVYCVSPDRGDEEAYRQAYPEGVERVLRDVSARRFLLVSSTSVYGVEDGGWVDESTPTEPTHTAGRHIGAAEQLVLQGAQSPVVVRASGIYGPGRTSLVTRVRSGVPKAPAEPVFTNRIHRDDLVGVLQFLLERPSLTGLFLATDTEPTELGQLQAWLAARLGVPAPPRAVEPEPEISPEQAPQVRSRHRRSRRCVPRRLLEEGYRFVYPTFREGYAALISGLS